MFIGYILLTLKIAKIKNKYKNAYDCLVFISQLFTGCNLSSCLFSIIYSPILLWG